MKTLLKIFLLSLWIFPCTAASGNNTENEKTPNWIRLAVAYENTRREKLEAEPAEYLNGFYTSKGDAGETLSSWINYFHAKFLCPALGETFSEENVRYTGKVYYEKKRHRLLDFRKNTLRTKFGIFEKLSLPEGATFHIDGYGNDFVEPKSTLLPIIKPSFLSLAKSPCEKRTIEFIGDHFLGKNDNILKVYFRRGFRSQTQSKISGFGMQIFEDEIHIFSGTPEAEKFALSVLEEVLSSDAIPRNTIFLCALPESGEH